MSRYRKRPVEVDAERWNGKFENGVVRYEYERGFCGVCGKPSFEHGWIDTLEAGHRVCPGDWIITGVQGERYPCKPDIFEQTYEAVPRIKESAK